MAETTFQATDQIVDIGTWQIDPEFPIYPEGSKPKTAHTSPIDPPFDFLLSNHRYLYKLSMPRYPAQFWTEIVAYRIGALMKVPVPPAFVATNTANGTTGAIIEWFYRSTPEITQSYISGGDHMQRRIENYDRKRGTQHNLEDVFALGNVLERARILASGWDARWARMLAMDALLGNTDRHQDNWGLVFSRQNVEEPGVIRGAFDFAPAYDNGTSMGHEILERKLGEFEGQTLEKYVARGTHHLKWLANDAVSLGHSNLLVKLSSAYPNLKSIMVEALMFDDNEIDGVINQLAAFQCVDCLSSERAAFMKRLLRFRKEKLLSDLA